MKHQIKVSVQTSVGLVAALYCVDHPECGYPEAFEWDMSAAMENYFGRVIEFPPLDIEVIGCDEESGIEWQLVTQESSERGSDDGQR